MVPPPLMHELPACGGQADVVVVVGAAVVVVLVVDVVVGAAVVVVVDVVVLVVVVLVVVVVGASHRPVVRLQVPSLHRQPIVPPQPSETLAPQDSPIPPIVSLSHVRGMQQAIS
jgi:hypothetical protein